MIARYNVPEIAAIWTEENRFQKFLQVEIALLQVLEDQKKIPEGTTRAFNGVKIKPERINEIEAITRHDVIAFCSSITEQVEPKHARFFHFGVTSSDILDTALSLQIKDSLELITADLKTIIDALKVKVDETKDLLCMGRSHGMYAEPMVFAQKFLSFEQELVRRLADYKAAIETEITGQISGAVGNYTILDAQIETKTLGKLGLKPETVSTQVIPRDRVAKIIGIGAMTAAALERMAVEFRLLHHSDVAEIYEGFKKGQKGSSTMPHKKNPISSENISGLSRVIRSHYEVALQDTILWHERDISHSSAERLILPDHFGLLSYAIKRMADTVTNLVINREKVEAKVADNFSSLSSFLLHEMILLNPTSREELYALVQEASFNSKTIDQFFGVLQSKSQENGLKMPAGVTPLTLKTHYFSRFAEVLRRSR
ncbi:MAG TPA: adenylosuccinate lyase [Bacteriovoracaceae bacterium]|nr:adenylosuccinate lyase [Bacteriovoracaceae bacterium]